MRLLLQSAALVSTLLPTPASAQCPFASRLRASTSSSPLSATGESPVARKLRADEPKRAVDPKQYRAAVEKLDWEAVKKDIQTLLVTDQDWWPSDYGTYGPLMIRLAWHCAGTYRASDGLGGCDGARQRFEPELSWPDNTNLDKARKLLVPIKEKYGLGLSWGDLIILTGNVAIESMGGPVLGFCAGRTDDADGTDSFLLGPTPDQEAAYPCAVNGKCESPLGASVIGLIYVNPEGFMGNPVPEESAPDIRDVFGRMSMNDSETISLIGGGHAFGKTHGACPAGAGPSPKEDPSNPWPGACGTGKGADTFTSGFEGPWTSTPTRWSNTYFKTLANNEFESHVGPGGHHQWRVKGENNSQTMMLTTDVAMKFDPKGEYQKLVQLYASNLSVLSHDFSHSWYKLVTRDMGPVTRCIGPYVAPAQEFQNPLPPPPAKLANFAAVKESIRKVMTTERRDVAPADMKDGKPDYTAFFAQLAYQCATTFRRSDYQGGCNGARIRFSPESDWASNQGTQEALKLLEPVKEQYGEGLTWADLIVLAGTTAVEQSSGRSVDFCGGRSDAEDGYGSKSLQPNTRPDTPFHFRFKTSMLDLSQKEMVALYATPRSVRQMQRLGYNGSWSGVPGELSSQYFSTLLGNEWTEVPGDVRQFKADGKDNVYMTSSDLLLKTDTDLRPIAEAYARDNSAFLNVYTSAWEKVMNNDRFDGPTGNVCEKRTVDIQAAPAVV